MVTIECPARALPLIAGYLPRGFTPPSSKDSVRVEIPFAHYGSLTQFVGSHPGIVTVIAPGSAREAVAQFASRTLERYDSVS